MPLGECADMAEKRRFLDVWLVETNTVYKEVPFAVVTDWVQQGRVLEADMWKPSGTAQWFPFGGKNDFTPYFPKPEVNRTEDQAEALEPVHLDFTYKRPREEEDDEVDMIPLIDVSLVLLVFFMLSATTAAAGIMSLIQRPEVTNTLMTDDPKAYRIDVSSDAGQPIYSLSPAGRQPDENERDLRNLAALLDRLKVRLDRVPADEPVEVVINADKDLPNRHVRDLLLALRTSPYREKIRAPYFGATQKEQ
jgi:biopolymer transport protein ExbD